MTLEFWHHHGGISVPDLDASIAWWHDIMNFRLLRRFTIEAVPCEVAVMANGSLHVELFEVEGARAPTENRSDPHEDLRSWGHKHLCFAVANVPPFAEALRARGADIVWVKNFPFGSNIFIRDNAGNLIEFVEQERLKFEISAL